MKKKINLYMLMTVFMALVATLLMAVAIFHHMYREQIVDDMQTCAEMLGGIVSSGEELKERYTNPPQQMRVTVIDENGLVTYDSQTGADAMNNHSDRPEIRDAEKSGEGHAVRHSDTLNSDMYYYALQLENGDILRISKEEDSIWSVFYHTMYGLLAIGVLMFLICFVLSRYITASIVRPIGKLAQDINDTTTIDTYEELTPFITTIQEQHKDIIKGAKMRQEFTANVSHELKTPLTSISGYAELIETGIAGENEVQRFAREIHRNSKRLLTLINDIIRLSELDGGHMDQDVSCTEVDLHDIAQTCVEMLQLNAEKHGIRIACHGTRCIIRANKEMMEELLFNLCDNAIRYNRLGGTVDVTVEEKDGCTTLSVRDTGIGIPKESQERVFERFYRVDKSRSKLTGGTGLGMAIVKHIVAQHGAELSLQSEVGVGTEIVVTFHTEN